MRVRMVLNEKALPFEVVEEDLKNFSPQLRALHPEAKVPVLVHGTRVLYESSVITEYLEDLFPSVALMPKGAGERAEVRLWTYWCNAVFKPDVDRFKYGTNRFGAEECLGVSERVQQHLAKLEKALNGKHALVGDYSLADIHVFPFVRQLVRVQPAPSFLALFPATLNWVRLISDRPAFLTTLER
jgi:glutathione S-transferase